MQPSRVAPLRAAERRFASSRRVMRTAMGDAEGRRRPDSVCLQVVGGGNWDPEVVRMQRLFKHWQKEAEVYTIADTHWESLADTSGISLMRRTLGRAGVGSHSCKRWDAGGRTIDALRDAHASAALGAAVVAARWRR